MSNETENKPNPKKLGTMLKVSKFLGIVSLILSHLMCIVAGYQWMNHICGMNHSGWSAPVEVSLIYTVPYILGIIGCLIVAFILRRKAKKGFKELSK